MWLAQHNFRLRIYNKFQLQQYPIFLLDIQFYLIYLSHIPYPVNFRPKYSISRKLLVGPQCSVLSFRFVCVAARLQRYLLCGQPYASTLMEMCPFHSCGLNLRYMASNTLTSLRTTVSWSLLPVRVCIRLKW